MIFYADDDEDDIVLMKDLAEKFKRTVFPFTHGLFLIDRLRTPPPSPSIVILDINMPLVSGLDILWQIRENPAWKRIPIVMLSTAPDSETIDKAYEYGATYFMVKSTDYQLFKERLRQVLSHDWEHYARDKKNFIDDSLPRMKWPEGYC